MSIGVNAFQIWGGSSHSLILPLSVASHSPPSFPLSSDPLNSARGQGGERCKVPQPSGSEWSPATKRILVHLEVKMKRLRGQIFLYF